LSGKSIYDDKPYPLEISHKNMFDRPGLFGTASDSFGNNKS